MIVQNSCSKGGIPCRNTGGELPFLEKKKRFGKYKYSANIKKNDKANRVGHRVIDRKNLGEDVTFNKNVRKKKRKKNFERNENCCEEKKKKTNKEAHV